MDSTPDVDSQLCAIEAAVRIAADFGIRADEPVLLRSTNNTVAWLRPAPIVAKVGLGRRPGFEREISVALELGALGAPIVPPSHELPAVVHSRDAFEITFWRYCPQPPDLDIPSAQVIAALQRLHSAYAVISRELRGALPSYMAELDSVEEVLRTAERLPALTEADRGLLRNVFEHLRARMLMLSATETQIVIHGSPHPYNVLAVDGEPRFIDFETTAIGPMEWDLAHTAPDTDHPYACVANAQLLRLCRAMVSVKTAVWCWADADRGDLRYHAEIHLERVKEMFPDYA